MIIHPFHPDHGQATFVLNAGHAEYTLPEGHTGKHEAVDDHALVATIWDPHNLSVCDEGLFGNDDDRLLQAAKLVLQPVLDNKATNWDPTWENLYVVYARRAGCERLLKGLLADMTDPGGDDDVFDYWPSACRMAHAFASDLDRLTGKDIYTALYRNMLIEVRGKQRDPEYFDDDPGVTIPMWDSIIPKG